MKSMTFRELPTNCYYMVENVGDRFFIKLNDCEYIDVVHGSIYRGNYFNSSPDRKVLPIRINCIEHHCDVRSEFANIQQNTFFLWFQVPFLKTSPSHAYAVADGLQMAQTIEISPKVLVFPLIALTFTYEYPNA